MHLRVGHYSMLPNPLGGVGEVEVSEGSSNERPQVTLPLLESLTLMGFIPTP